MSFYAAAFRWGLPVATALVFCPFDLVGVTKRNAEDRIHSSLCVTCGVG